MATATNNFYSNVDHLQMLLALMRMYNMTSSDISAIRSIGFNAHVLTNINDAVLFKANSAIRESNILTATKLDSLYKHGRKVGINPAYSIPASMMMNFIIEEKEFELKSTKNGDVRSYRISKYNWVSVGNFGYSLDYDIEIRLETGLDNEKYLTARYVMDGEENIMSNIVNPTIKAIRIRDEDGWKYHLHVRLQQYMREPFEREFDDRDYSLFPISTMRKTDEIAGIDIYYRNTGGTRLITTKRLKQKLYIESSRTSEDSVFLRFDKINAFTIIHKSQESNFRPLVGDKLAIHLYTTTGSRANFQYSVSRSSSILFRTINNAELNIIVELIDRISSGGQSFDQTVESLRRDIIAKKSTYDAIIIENDLTMQLNRRKTGNEYSCVKYRNDIMKLFNIFTTLRFSNDGNSFIVPTNTLTIDWKFKEDSEEIEPGSKVYMQTAKVVTSNAPLVGKIIQESAIGTVTSDNLIYWNPFVVSYDMNLNLLRLYDPYIDEKFWTDYYLLNNKLPYSWICNWVTFKKDDYNTQFSAYFQLRFNLTEQMPKETLFNAGPNGEIIDADFIKVYLVLNNKKNEEVYRARCKMVGYTKDPSNQDDYFDYELIMIEDGEIAKIHNDKMRIKDPDNNTYIWVDVEDLTGSIEVVQPTEKDPLTGLLIANTQVVNRFTFDCWLTKNRTKDHKIQHSVIDNDTLKLHHYPLVQYEFYKNHLSYYKGAVGSEYNIEQFLSKFQGEFSYSIKFANTYGYSQNYTIGLTNNKLNNVMLTFNFIIEKGFGSTITEKQLNAEVARYLGSINFLKYDEFHVSNLQKYLKDVFPRDIKFIQFLGVNNIDDNEQLISMNISSLENTTVIEKLNLPLVYYPDEMKFGYKINWTYR